MTTATTYRTLLRTPGAAAFFAPTAAGRVGIAMTSLSIVWLVRDATGSYATAGLVTGAFAVADALAGPQAGRLIDRYGQRRVLPPAVLAHAAAVATLVLSAAGHAPGWLLAAAGALVGATLPQLSAVAQARWSALLDGPRRSSLPAAYALESLSNSVAYLIGPALVSTIAAAGRPVVGTLAAAALVVAGGGVLALQRRTTPPVVPRDARRPHHRRALLRPGFLLLIGVNATIGGFFGTMSIAVTALAVERDRPGLAAVLFAASNGTGLLAVVLYGLRPWRPHPRRQLAAAGALLGVGSLPLLAAAHLPAVTAGVLLTALAVPVVLVLGAVLADAVVTRGVLTEAFAWLGSASAAGSALAATVAGLAVDSRGAGGGLLVAVAAACATAACTLAGLRALRPPPGPVPEP
ncbi:MFS transporter [Dactylosporangium aurantiacum]|uniref:MFS transporter n=1 Tax=Dactylosporangium aurantiacum TaxID=35754 RepID=A0A9Q9MJF2_9ACTN|nr:MFS transporter [Dactylosporangium aurantiacum]MDG6103662.1 MFS transporter [Dactylosporangium aurantiacum]UWZ51852.1 MFS transporter [Dactylosporangium aurantiacum]